MNLTTVGADAVAIDATPAVDSGPTRPSIGSSRWLRSAAAFLAVFLVILAARWEVVDSPPAYDFAFGVWSEAAFLARTDFDYRRLLFDEPHSLDLHGGPRSYMTSVAPTLLGLLMKASGDSATCRVTYHLTIFAFASAVAVLFYSLLSERVDATTAVMASLAVLTTPVFSVQIDMTGLEMPLIACSLASAAMIRRERFLSAACFSTAAFFVKPTGSLVVVATIVLLGLLLASAPREDFRRRRWTAALIVNALILLLQVLLLVIGASFDKQMALGPPLWMTLVWCPDVALISAAATIGGGAVLLHRTMKQSSTENLSFRIAFFETIRCELLLAFSWMLLVGIYFAAARVRFVPRYLAIAVPFAYLLAVPLLAAGLGSKRWTSGVLAAVVAVNLVNWNGALFPDPTNALAKALGPPARRLSREASFLERSREYLQDHRDIQKAMQVVERHASDGPVLAGIPFTYFLSFPILGYVTHPIGGYAINGFADAADGFKDVAELLVDAPPRPIFIATLNGFYFESARFRVPSPTAEDVVLFEPAPDAGLVVFQKGWGKNSPSRDALIDWYLDRLWPPESVDGRTFACARADRRKWERPLGRRRPSSSDAEVVHQLERGCLAFVDNRKQADAENGLGASDLNPRGVAKLQQGRASQAAEILRESLRQEPSNADVHNSLGLCYVRQNRPSDALEEFHQACRIDPFHSDAWNNWNALKRRLSAPDSGAARP